ncbi:MAG: acyltransferase [Nitrospira sp.]|nr:acyltransferase [bacterium]MBL7049090.1 acyltransferase [Nitrospira sp.]
MIAGIYQLNPVFGEVVHNFQKVEAALSDTTADLIVLPEFFATGYQFASQKEIAELSEEIPAGPTTDFLCRLSASLKCHIVGGLPEREGDRYFNSAILTGPEGFIGSYRKTHLFYEETLYFTPGDSGFKVWDTQIGRIGIMICFDWFFPESMRTLALMGADIVAHPSNLVLPFCPDSMPVRCLENRVAALTANRVGTEDRTSGNPLTFIGNSEIVSAQGKILTRASMADEEIITAKLNPADSRNKSLNQYNNLFTDRRPGIYKL